MVSVALALAAPASIAAEPRGDLEPNSRGGVFESRLEIAKEEAGDLAPPPSRYRLPAGELRVASPEILAASGQLMRFSVEISRPVQDATLTLTLPRRWLREPPSGVDTTLAPHLEDATGGRADLARAGRRMVLSFGRAQVGDVAGFRLRDAGIPAGTYRLRFSWRGGSESRTRGSARVVLYAPAREEGEASPVERLANPGVAENASEDATEESETFVAVTPGDSNRVAVGSNWQAASMPAWVSEDAGHSWVQRTMPQTIDAPGEASPEAGDICCDPMFAADELGNFWFGGLALPNGTGVPSRIVVNRIGAGTTSFQPQTTGLPIRTAGIQDKPMMTIDDTPTSPTHGRLYVAWDEPSGGGVNLVISQCDTRPGGVPNAANCDNADSWSTPVSVTPAAGSYIYTDVAVGPDGHVYFTWWDYSSTNAIRGDVCDPATQDCASASGWGTPQTIAVLDSTGGDPVPFACAILAQPGGRAAPTPQVDVDHSGGPENGRVYVSWSDLRPGSGSTRCAIKPNGDGTTPLSTHLTWDSFVASADGALPGGAFSSTSVGTRLYTDSSEGGAITNSDEWFSWLAVDQTTGQAWADFYSTRDDATREKTNFYARSVTPSGGGHNLGTLTKVSAAQSDYSANQCCKFGNDYGDYEGLDATGGLAYPVWTDNSTGDGDVFTFVSEPPGSPPTATTGSATAISQTSATLNGTVDPNGQATTYHFEYGTTTAYGTQTADQSAGSGNSGQPVSASVGSLSAGTEYHFRLVAENASGTSTGDDATFTTDSAPPGSAPSAVTEPASLIAETSARLNGTVNPNALPTSYHFDYGVDGGPFTDSTSSVDAGSGTTGVAASADISGLAAGTTYRYQLEAANSAGTTPGGELTFKTTSPTPPPPPPPPPEPQPTLLDTSGPIVSIQAEVLRLTRKGVARVPIGCPSSEPDGFCAGSLSLATAKRVRFSGRRKKVTLGGAGFRIGAGDTKVVAVGLSRRKRALVVSRGRLAALATARAIDLAANIGTAQRTLTLAAPRP
jgi:hypothetical protein